MVSSAVISCKGVCVSCGNLVSSGEFGVRRDFDVCSTLRGTRNRGVASVQESQVLPHLLLRRVGSLPAVETGVERACFWQDCGLKH